MRAALESLRPGARGRTALTWLLAAGLVALLAGCGDENAPAQATPSPTPSLVPLADPAPAHAVRSITRSELSAIVYRLASEDLAGRGSGQGSDEVAARLIAQHFREIGLWYESGREGFLQRFSIGAGRGYTFNVIGVLPGIEPHYAERPLVIGAHFDHLGVSDGEIYPGADDNASGTALVMELAEAMVATGSWPRRPVIFAAFGGEELGLLGSRQWVSERLGQGGGSEPLLMINADMVGHVDSGGLRAIGVGPGDPLAEPLRILSLRNDAGQVAFYPDASGGSDHVPFAALGIPVVFLHTGLHARYHRPTDTADTLDYAGLEAVTRVAFELAWNVADVKQLPALTAPVLPAPSDWQTDHGVRPFVSPRLFGD
jgi:hypothetical protein